MHIGGHTHTAIIEFDVSYICNKQLQVVMNQ